jgi:hypothetical protein
VRSLQDLLFAPAIFRALLQELRRTVAASVGSQIRPLLPDSGIRAARNGQSFAKYAPSAFTDVVNYIIDNENQKALRVVGVRSASARVTMPSAAN